MRDAINGFTFTYLDPSRLEPLVAAWGSGFLRPNGSPLPASCTVVHSMRDALKFGAPDDWSEMEVKETPVRPIGTLTLGPAAPTKARKMHWYKLLTAETISLPECESWQRFDSKKHLARTELGNLLDVIDGRIRSQLRGVVDPGLAENTLTELVWQSCVRLIVIELLMGDTRTQLGGDILDVLAAGGMPCGWRDKYPAGGMVVYWPHPESPTFRQELPS